MPKTRKEEKLEALVLALYAATLDALSMDTDGDGVPAIDFVVDTVIDVLPAEEATLRELIAKRFV